jgi:integrase
MRKTLTEKGVAALKPRPQRYAYPDPELRGHYVRVQPSGAKAYVTVARDPQGKQVWATIGGADVMDLDEARKRARAAIQRVRDGLPALEVTPAKQSFESIAEQWLARHVSVNGLRSEKEINRLLKVHVFPAWKGRGFLAIRRSEVAEVLDNVQDNHGARQADYVLNVVRSIMNWYATRHDDYTPPIVRGMRRQNAKAQARARILDDKEIRQIWNQAQANGTFGAIVRTCLLTAQRSRKVSAMKWSDVVAGEWTIPALPREKDTAGSLVLPEAARAIIEAQPQLGDNPYVFAGRGNGPYRGFSQAKVAFDAKLPHDSEKKPLVAPWVIHDLRRTARSLLSRAGVRPDISERVLGHVQPGVAGIYDRHSYRDEKAGALKALATLIDGIVHPRDNVVTMGKRKRKR